MNVAWITLTHNAADTQSISADTLHNVKPVIEGGQRWVDPHLEAFGERVRQLRVQQKLTQEQLAHAAGLQGLPRLCLTPDL